MPARKPNRTCPGCGLQMPKSEKVTYDGYFNCSPECWVIFEEVLAGASGDPAYQPVRQLLIDAYAAQHAGGNHPDRSVVVHLAGLHAAFDLEMPPQQVVSMLKRLATTVTSWPRLRPPEFPAPLTILEVAVTEGSGGVEQISSWASAVWNSWAEQHPVISRLVRENGS